MREWVAKVVSPVVSGICRLNGESVLALLPFCAGYKNGRHATFLAHRDRTDLTCCYIVIRVIEHHVESRVEGVTIVRLTGETITSMLNGCASNSAGWTLKAGENSKGQTTRNIKSTQSSRTACAQESCRSQAPDQHMRGKCW